MIHRYIVPKCLESSIVLALGGAARVGMKVEAKKDR